MTDDCPLSQKPTLTNQIHELANQCVKCALCLPYCPTYQLTQDENESPRGRIALFDALSLGQLPLSAHVQTHLDHCLGCRECERVCPAQVEYGKLLTVARTQVRQLAQKQKILKTKRATKWVQWLAWHPRALRAMQWSLWFCQQLGLLKVAQLFKIPKRLGLETLIQTQKIFHRPLKLKNHYLPKSLPQGVVSLFIGCFERFSDPHTLESSIHVLQTLGFEVLIEPEQTCCGAIALHAGEADVASKCVQKNLGVFHHDTPILSLATGCTSVLSHYPDYFEQKTDLAEAQLKAFSARSHQIIDFIHGCSWPQEVVLQSVPLTILLHTPCTYRNVLNSSQNVLTLLSRIPDLTIHCSEFNQCCGAAGTYLTEYPQIAQKLATQLLDSFPSHTFDALVTSNIGCHLHLHAMLEQQGKAIPVYHPIEIIAKALGFELKH